MRKWKQWVNILEKNPDKSVRELAKKFNKNHTWVQFLKTFYKATDEEKEKLKDKHAQYAAFYKVWKKEAEVEDAELLPEEDNTSNKTGNTLPRIPYYQIQDLKKVIKMIALENKHLVEENNSFAEDNLYKAKSINQLINEKNELQEELKNTKLELKVTRYGYYTTVVVAIIFIIMAVIKCSG